MFAVDPLRERVADQSVIEIENVFERDSLAVDLAESIDGRADQVVCVALLSLGPEIHGSQSRAGP